MHKLSISDDLVTQMAIKVIAMDLWILWFPKMMPCVKQSKPLKNNDNAALNVLYRMRQALIVLGKITEDE